VLLNSEILGSKRIGVPSLTYRSRYVIRQVTIWFCTGHFLSMVVFWTKHLSLTVSKIFSG